MNICSTIRLNSVLPRAGQNKFAPENMKNPCMGIGTGNRLLRRFFFACTLRSSRRALDATAATLNCYEENLMNMTAEQKQKLVGAAVASAVLLAIAKFVPNQMVKAAALGALGVVVATKLPVVKEGF
jgi:hypothetical protein